MSAAWLPGCHYIFCFFVFAMCTSSARALQRIQSNWLTYSNCDECILVRVRVHQSRPSARTDQNSIFVRCVVYRRPVFLFLFSFCLIVVVVGSFPFHSIIILHVRQYALLLLDWFTSASRANWFPRLSHLVDANPLHRHNFAVQIEPTLYVTYTSCSSCILYVPEMLNDELHSLILMHIQVRYHQFGIINGARQIALELLMMKRETELLAVVHIHIQPIRKYPHIISNMYNSSNYFALNFL